MKAHWIWMTTHSRVGPVRQRKLLARFGSAEALFAASQEELEREGVEPEIRHILEDHSLNRAEAILRDCERGRIRVLTLADPDFPAALRDLPNLPTVLYLRGELPDLEQRPGIALVGSREMSERGAHIARQLGWQIAGCGGVVITGMAKGIDAAAALGALDNGGRVIGVLGCGPDVVYPLENRRVYERVLRQGCLLTEYPPRTRPNAGRFPARNRIISALSVGVTVVRAALKSGALITARCAMEQNRDLFAVPGDPDDPTSLGCISLLREGASPVLNGWDIISEYEYRYPAAVREYHGRPPAQPSAPTPGDPLRAARDACSQSADPLPPDPADPFDASHSPAPKPLPANLTPLQRQITEVLSGGPCQLDALIAALELPAFRVLPQLTVLQMKGVIACLPGKIYTLA